MADFVKTTTTNRYIGASTDTKPASCLSGSTCLETDTDALYYTADGGTTWVQIDRLVSLSGVTLQDVDTDAGDTRNVVPVALMLPGASPAAAPGDGTNGLKAQGAGVAGTPAGGVMSVQGVASGTVLPVSEASGTGAYTTPTHSAPTAGVATGVILAANASRLYALFVNDSDTVVYLALGVAAVLNTGIRVNALGGSYEMSRKAGNLYAGAVNGISGIAGKILLVTEGV